MILKIITLLFVTTLTLLWMSFDTNHQPGEENTPPKVTITTPSAGTRFQWSAIIPYHIAVVDKEDGNSEYNEIPSNQVLFSIRYLADSTRLKDFLRRESTIKQDVLYSMASTTCFTCHQMKSKLIGPSFELIAKKYPENETNVKSLAQKVITGGKGVWGDVLMPPHPDLKVEQVEGIVRWVLKNGSNPDQDYLIGVEGVFRTRERPANNSQKGVYVLTASYADSGDKVTTGARKIGQNTMMLRSKE